MSRTAVQLYTLRSLDVPVTDLVTFVGDCGYQGVEFAGLGGESAAAVAAALDAAGVAAAGAHVSIETLEAETAATVERYAALGCSDLVVPWLDPAHFADERAVTETAQRLDELAADVADHGATLHYHNHDHELAAVGDRSALVALFEATDRVRFEVDVGWVAAGGGDPVALLREYGDRIPLVHVTDATADREATDLGAGVTDVPACVAAARDAGARWLVYEHDDPADPRRSVEGAIDALQ